MAEITLNIPDPIHDRIKRRAEQTKNTDIGIIIATLALTFGAAFYDHTKWLQNLDEVDDKSKPW